MTIILYVMNEKLIGTWKIYLSGPHISKIRNGIIYVMNEKLKSSAAQNSFAK